METRIPKNAPTLIKLKVHPGSRRSKVIEKSPDTFEIWVRAKPEGGLANRESLYLLAETLKRPAGTLRIIRGATGRHKIVLLR